MKNASQQNFVDSVCMEKLLTHQVIRFYYSCLASEKYTYTKYKPYFPQSFHRKIEFQCISKSIQLIRVFFLWIHFDASISLLNRVRRGFSFFVKFIKVFVVVVVAQRLLNEIANLGALLIDHYWFYKVFEAKNPQSTTIEHKNAIHPLVLNFYCRYNKLQHKHDHVRYHLHINLFN